MKQRTFFTTLILFLFCFNVGIFLVTFTMFKETIKNAEERSLMEHYILTSAIVKDFEAVKGRGIEIEGAIDSLLHPYRDFSDDKKVGLAFYKQEQLLYLNGPEVVTKNRNKPNEGSRQVSFQKDDQGTYVYVSGKLPAPFNEYTLDYFYDTTDAIEAWKRMRNMLYTVGITLSVVLALGLLLLLNRLFKPLSRISETSRTIAAGAYETRLPESGRDEVAEMGKSFNYMAAEIQRQMEELTTAAEKKQQFIDSFAHELYTPLTAIHGYAEYLQNAAIDEDERLSAVQYIMSESRRMHTMANQLLDLANLKNNQIEQKKQSVTNLFQSVKQMLHNKLLEKDIQMLFSNEIDIIYGDGYLLTSLFVNLVDNAINACEKGGRIRVFAVMEDEEKMIGVSDNGKGMPLDMMQHITDPFYRVEKSRNRSDGGTGLGLSICRQIVERHDAKLTFSSNLDKGTTVKVTFTSS